MKPNFTLSLSFDGIALLHRIDGGWRLIGEVPLTAEDLKADLAELRKEASGLEPAGLFSKVLVPNDQIRYLTVETPEFGDEARRATALRALDGATPYEMSELAFDISHDGPQTHLAAVALETLQEAEQFASEHGFGPVSFVAAPDRADFVGEPFFGQSRLAETLLSPEETVEPDDVAVLLPGTAEQEIALDDTADPTAQDQADPESSDDTSTAGFSSRRTAPQDQIAAIPDGLAEDDQPQATPATSRIRFEATPADGPRIPPAPDGLETTPIAAPEASASPSTLQARAKPRNFGVILTVAVLVCLVIVAAGAAISLDERVARLFNRTPPVVETKPPQEPTDVTEPVTASAAIGPSDEDTAVLDALRRVEPQLPPPVFNQEELAAKYAVTGIWPIAPDQPVPTPSLTLDDLYLASIDPVSLSFDAVALPSVEQPRTDNEIGEIRSPVGPGTEFDLDENGLVRATPEGALSPEGVQVYAGRPPLVPPVIDRPEETEDAGTAAAEAAVALAAFRPSPRPDGLAERFERAALGGLSRTELAAFRPQLRPESAQEAALANASLFPQDGAINAAVDAALAEPPANALLRSRRPDTRPANFARTVERATQSQPAQRVQTASLQTAPQTAAPRAVAPRTVTPRVRSSASVAREATVRNAINLRQVNLIGVYGSPSDRRALVRLANGRYRKVQVGDRIDGGRVSAIGDSELRYQKSGRNVVLRMPDS